MMVASTERLKVETGRVLSMIPFSVAEAKDTGFYVSGTTQSGKTTCAKHLVEMLTTQGINVYVVDVSKAWIDSPIDKIVTVPADATTVTIQQGESCVFDISALSYQKRVRYVIGFTKMLYEWHVAQGFKKAPFEFIVYEEAHTYFPNGCFRSPKQYSPCIDVVTVGANFNLRFGAITQFPAMLDKALVKICQQRYFGWSTEKNDLSYIRGFLGKDYVDPQKPDSVFNLKKGEFVYQLRNQIERIYSPPYRKEQPHTGYTLNSEPMFLKYTG